MQEPLSEQKLHLNMMERRLEDLTVSVSNLKIALAKLDPTSTQSGSDGLPNSVIVTPDDIPAFSKGFYLLEHDKTGRSYRWTGDGSFSEMRFFLDRSHRSKFVISGADYGKAELGPLKVFIDYIEIPHVLERTGDVFTISGDIPVDYYNPKVIITLWSPSRYVPTNAQGEVVENRTLWFVFYGLRIDPSAP